MQQLAGAHEAVRQDTFPRIPDLMTAAPVPRGWAANTVPPVDSYLELASCQGWPGNALDRINALADGSPGFAWRLVNTHALYAV
ncbi:hypothetical protein ABZ783_13310 [Micromonospora sp. NPDC047738]|uniref:hypothetical protein n=1 Tax=Micromonospora sp. NPDC047738 TaxID=3155741 RepID=UPI0033E9BF8A